MGISNKVKWERERLGDDWAGMGNSKTVPGHRELTAAVRC